LDARGVPAMWAAAIVKALDTYTEISPSGRGLKAFFYVRSGLVRTFLDLLGVDQNAWGTKRGIIGRPGGRHGPGIEIYASGRFFTVTGRRWPASPNGITLLNWPELQRLARLVPARSFTSERRRAADEADVVDNSRSARAWRAAQDMNADSYEAMADGLRNHEDPDIREWVREKGEAYNERELHRVWQRAVLGESEDAGDDNVTGEADDLAVYDLKTDRAKTPPRPWLSYFSFCRSVISMLTGVSGVGKSAVRILYLLALATGRMDLTGEQIWRPCRVMFVSFEEDLDEIRRRVRAAVKFYDIDPETIEGEFFYVSLGDGTENEKLMVLNRPRHPVT
jgi:hypothetical protein